MNMTFTTRQWVHVHHGTERSSEKPPQEPRGDMLRTIAWAILAGTLVVLVVAGLALYPDIKNGTRYITNQFNTSHIWTPWGSMPY